jgi:hypothetical protein
LGLCYPGEQVCHEHGVGTPLDELQYIEGVVQVVPNSDHAMPSQNERQSMMDEFTPTRSQCGHCGLG